MAIFPRRIIQRLLDENRAFLSETQITEHVKRLNANDNGTIATEWEILLLNVLSKVGRVQHEIELSGTKKPDIFFEAPKTGEFVADITAISDESYDKENPIAYFYECLNKYFHTKGLTAGGLRVDVDGENIGEYGDRKVKLRLPTKNDIPSFIRKKFNQIAEAIKCNPNQAFKTNIGEGNVSIKVIFNPKEKYFGGAYPSYSVVYSLSRNPLSYRLRKKAAQLKKSGYEGIMGVFVCDAACASLNNDFHGVSDYSQDKIVEEVFRGNSSLSFVLVLSPEEQRPPFGQGVTKSIKARFYSNRAAKYPINDAVLTKLQEIAKFFPVPESMPINASRRLNTKKDGGLSHYGGCTMSGNKIKISSRMITEMFAGVLDFNKFDKDHKAMSSDNKNYITQFFLNQVMQGKMIRNVSIEKCQDEDDDWIEFEYGEPDPAISKFK
jgi:hypothetical protein